MISNVTPASFVSLTLMITGLIISLVLSIFGKKDNRSNQILSAAIMTITASVAIGFIMQTYLILEVPHFYRTAQIVPLISSPLLFLYVRSVTQRIALQPSDLVYALPLLFYVIDYLPFFSLSKGEKIQLIQDDLYGYYEANDFDEGWLTNPGFHAYFQYLVMFFFLFMQFRILFLLYSERIRDATPICLQTRSWLTYLIVSQVMAFVPLFVKPHDPDTQWTLAMISLGLPIPLTTASLFLRPWILYGLNLSIPNLEVKTKKSADMNEKQGPASSRTHYDPDLEVRLHDYVLGNKKFLQHRYTINRLAADLDVPPHQISAFLNQHLNTSFSEFLNNFRIEYCIERMKNGDASRLTLEALASECGFSNRNSFTAAFKRLTGQTPSEYMRDLA